MGLWKKGDRCESNIISGTCGASESHTGRLQKKV